MKSEMIRASLLVVAMIVLGGVLNFRTGRVLGISSQNLVIEPIKDVFGFARLLWNLNEKDSDPVVLVAVGDVMLGRSVNGKMVVKNDWTYPFLEVGSMLREADVTFGNLESPFGESCSVVSGGMVFCADQRSVAGLVWSGFDVMSLENNHNTNQGRLGLELSEKLLEEKKILGVVEGEIEVVEQEGLKLGFLAVDDVSRRVDEGALVKLIEDAEKVVDVVVVSVHWGWEYRAIANERQVRLGRKMVDSGADLVLGHHPHWVQNVENYGGGVIVYSLGNFVFDQMWSEETRRGVVGRFELSEEGVGDYRFEKVRIYEYSQPRFEEW